MRGSLGILSVHLFCVVAYGGAVEIPADKRIEAKVVRTLTAPADQAMHMPTDVAVDKTGRVYVADGTNDRLVRFNPDGKFDIFITSVGEHKLNRPIGLTVDARDRLWVADTGNHRVLVLSADIKSAEIIDLSKIKGEAKSKGESEGEKLKALDLTDVSVTADLKRTYIVDNENHRVLIRDNDSGEITITGKFGSAAGQFRWPFMIDVGPDGDVFVTEVIGARVQWLTAQGNWNRPIERWGIELGHLYRPKGVVVDSFDNILVSDSTLGVIQAFSPQGFLKGILTDHQGEPLRFKHPMGMCFDAAQRLYVVELTADRVAVVSLYDVPKSADTRPAEADGGNRR